MKFVLILAIVIGAAVAQHNHQHPHPDHGGDPLHDLLHDEVQAIVSSNPGISVSDCSTKCDALFDLNAGHDEEMTDKLCQEECAHQVQAAQGGN